MKKIFTFLAAASLMTVGNAQPVELSHNSDDTIVGGAGVACPGGDNEFARVFFLDDFGIVDDLEVNQIDWGIESLQGAESLTVNLATTDYDFPYGDIDYVWSDTDNYPVSSLVIMETAVPNYVIPAGTDAIMASVAQGDTGVPFYPGGTMPGTSDDISWLKSENCGATNFEDVTGLGDFPNANWYIVVRGEVLMGTVELGTSNGIGVYPNPTTDIINIALRNGAEVESVEVVNLAGQSVAQAKAVDNVNLSFLAPGVYVVKIKDNKGVTHMTKVVKK